MSVVVHTVLDLPVLTPGCRTPNCLVYTAHVQGSHSSLTGSIILPPVLFDPPYYGAFTSPVPVLLIWELHALCWVNTGFPLYSQSFRVPCMLFQHLALAAVNMAPVLPFSVVGSEQCPAASPFLLLANRLILCACSHIIHKRCCTRAVHEGARILFATVSSCYSQARILFTRPVAPPLATIAPCPP